MKKSFGFQNNAAAGNALKGSFIANSDKKKVISLKEKVILAILVKYPTLIEPNKEKLTTMEWHSKDYIRFLEEILINSPFLISPKRTKLLIFFDKFEKI